MKDLKNRVAKEYYNVIYGAKLNFALVDIIKLLPTSINYVSIVIGLAGFFIDFFGGESASFVLISGSILSMQIKTTELEIKDQKINDVAVRLTRLSKELESLYFSLRDSDQDTKDKEIEFKALQDQHSEIDQCPKNFLCKWYAHYKIFLEGDHKWMCDELNIGILKKIPASAKFVFSFLIILCIYFLFGTDLFSIACYKKIF